MAEMTKELVVLHNSYVDLYESDDEEFEFFLKNDLEDEDFQEVLMSSNEKIKSFFQKPYNKQGILDWLKKANDKYEAILKEAQYEFFKRLEIFDKADFLKTFFSAEESIFVLDIYSDKAVTEEFSDSVYRSITFESARVYHNGSSVTDSQIDIFFDTIQLIEENDTYILEFKTYLNYETEIYQIKFSNISVLLKAYSALEDSRYWLFIDTPWDYVTAIAENINAHRLYGLETPEEKQISSLILHLTGYKLTDAVTVPAVLYDLIQKYNLQKVIKAPYDLTALELCQKKFEPLWRDIFNLLVESQENLPSYFEETVDAEDVKKHKVLVTDHMNSLGYVGEYPDFYKKDRLIKPTLLRAYNLSYVVGFEKYAEHHIHCWSFKNNDVIHTVLFSGVIFNKTDDVKTDVYSTMFDCKGKATFAILSTLNAGAMNSQTYEEWTKKAIDAAVRKSELKKAEKEDYFFKNIFSRNPTLNPKFLVLIFIIFTVGFSLIVPLLLILIDGRSIHEVIIFLKEEPMFFSVGVIGGALATTLIALVEWISSKR